MSHNITLTNPTYRFYEVHTECTTCEAKSEAIGGFDADDTTAKLRLISRSFTKLDCKCKDK